jgi:hypothetical protein
MKTLSLWKISSAHKSIKLKLDELYSNKNTNNELHVACLYNLPSYRTGIGGWIVTFFCYYVLPKTYFLSSIFKQLRWTSDSDIFSRTISYINRLIPILNFGTWNAKKHFLYCNKNNSIFQYGGENDKSLSGMFDICSPFFDSGCAIISNIPCRDTDFEAFDVTKPNRGILWSYFAADQVLVMTISTDGDSEKTMEEMQKIFETQKTISKKYNCKQTYIIGDFKRDIIFDRHLQNHLIDGFNAMSIDGTSYLIYDYTYTPMMENNLLKINSVLLSSPVHPSTPKDKEQTTNPIMYPIPEIEVLSTSPPPCNTPTEKEKPTDEKETEEDVVANETLQFPYIIFNYFSSSGKTSPKPSSPEPAASSPQPASSPTSSDDGWSKV